MRLCRTDEEIDAAARDRVKNWKLTQRQKERLLVLLRPYAHQLLAAVDRAENDPAA